MELPRWVVFVVAGWVILFGAFRIFLAFRNKPKEEGEQRRGRGGLFGMHRRTHFLIGVLYLILGTFLILSAFGWRPFQIG